MKYHVRKADREITDPVALRKVLNETEYMTLAMVKDNEPYLVSLSYSYDEERNCLYFHCAREGKKLDYLHANPNVWGQVIVDGGYLQKECTHSFTTVMFKGKVRFIEDLAEKSHAMKLMIMRLDSEPEAMMKKKMDMNRVASTVFGSVDIEFLTGKKTPTPS